MDLRNATLSWACHFVLTSSDSGPWECNFVFVSSARQEVPKVDLGNATLSWYRLLVSPARGEVPKVDLGNAT